ncbi:MAG: hypothetical protein FJ254_09965 [Phycisphaerae bacterium]|nr:hypothetical protein [Phycisphaerae bacterium]
MKHLACMLTVATALMACDSDPASVDRAFGTENERAREQEQLNAVSEQDDANNADASITNDAQMEPLIP